MPQDPATNTHKDPYEEIEYAKPPPLPTVTLKNPCVPIAVTLAVNQLVREALRLQQSGPAEFIEAPFMRLVSNLMKLQKLVEPMLPGMGDEPKPEPPSKKGRCTEVEAVAYCRSLGLPESDGQWFFAKMEGNGWKNGGKAVKDWQQTIRAWNIAHYMASQKVARNQPLNNASASHTSKEIDSELRRIRKGLL